MIVPFEHTAPHDPCRSLPEAEQSLATAFARAARRYASRTALGSGDWRPTYEELNLCANRAAHALSLRGAPGDRLALLMRHDTPLIAAMLSGVKAGKIVVTLNPGDPVARLQQLREDAEPSVILTDASSRKIAATVAGSSAVVLDWDQLASDGPAHDPEVSIRPEDTAFLIYTSGSTGRPKAVRQTHRQILHNTVRHSRAMAFAPEDRVALLASPSGAQAVSTAWCTLLNGASLCLFPAMERGVTGLHAWMNEHGITVYISAASLFRHFMRTLDEHATFPLVRTIRMASEPGTAEDFRAFQQHFAGQCRFVHTLASSETSNIAHLVLSRSDHVGEGRLPVGRASEGVEILLRDEHGDETRPGETGEIVVRSRYLSPGYWRNETLTAERFAEWPEGSGVRIFHTGDLGRTRPDGLLEFVGRKDTRVKIRGNRIEPSEVEEVVHALPGVERAAVCVVDGPAGEPALAAYVVLRDGHVSSASALRRAARAVLPRHMVPSAFVLLDRLPLSAHGKIDREKLRRSPLPLRATGVAGESRTETESLVAEIWADVLHLADVGPQDDFFDLGGDSLAAAVVGARILDVLGVEINLAAFADHPTLAAFAGLIDRMGRPETGCDRPRLARASREAPLPLSFFQERIWMLSQRPEGNAAYTVARNHRIVGRLDVPALSACMSYIAKRHEILRTRFALVEGGPVQVIEPPAPVDLPVIDLAGVPDAEAHAARIFTAEAARIFDLSRTPLVRFTLIRVRDDEHWLLRVAHHIICDGWSWEIYFRELGALYEARLRGDAPPLQDSEPLHYADYAAWQRRALRRDGSGYHEAVAWWKALYATPAPPLALPFRRAQPAERLDPHEGTIRWGLDPRVSRALRELGAADGATYYVIRLAAYVALLAAETGERDVVIGTYVTNRKRIELQHMFGLFANLVAVRFCCEPAAPFREWLAIVKETVVAAEARAEIPYEELQKELRAAGVTPPEITAIFSVSHHHAVQRVAGLEVSRLDPRMERMPWGFSMNFDEHNEASSSLATFDAGIYDPAGVRRLIDNFGRLLEAVSREPGLPLNELLRIGIQ